jgi:hypothetical protein
MFCIVLVVEGIVWLSAPSVLHSPTVKGSTLLRTMADHGILNVYAAILLSNDVLGLRTARLRFLVTPLLEVSYPLLNAAVFSLILVLSNTSFTHRAWLTFRILISSLWISSSLSKAIGWKLFWEPLQPSEVSSPASRSLNWSGISDDEIDDSSNTENSAYV